jgi:BirA family transcriptional regulator, biotin operon repressor / biotin---[acetyl-CoA-carboxylase] ligase
VLVDDAARSRLAAGRFGRLCLRAETASTNADAAARAADGEAEGLVVVADYQSAGRGRLDRRWESPPGASLLFSVLLDPDGAGLEPGRRHLAVAAVSLAIAEAARVVAGTRLELKWPNDLLAGPAKVGGILAETALPAGGGARLVVGAGVNVHWAPPKSASTCLDDLAGRRLRRSDLLVETLLALDRVYGKWALVAQRYGAECGTVGRRVRVQRGGGQADLEGTAVAVDSAGHLVLRDAAGADVVVAAGDVAHATAYGA